MFRQIILTLFILFASQSTIFADVFRYRLFLDGKPDSQLVAFSERALERRQRLGIVSDEKDYAVSESYLQQLREGGFSILSCSRWLNSVSVMYGDGKEDVTDILSEFSFVKKVETLTAAEKTRAVFSQNTPNEQLEVTADAEEDCTTPLREVNAYEPLYQAGYRGDGILIAVLDCGYLRLNECDWLNDKVVYVHSMYEPTHPESLYADNSHGLQCLSIMACPEEQGVCGTAQEAKYCIFSTEKADIESAWEEDMWVTAAEMADSLGVDLISSSVGYSEYNQGILSHSIEELMQNTAFISQGAKIASQKGILVVSSAGNYGAKTWQKLLFPSDTEEVLTVGAYKTLQEAASFTGQGFLEPYVKPDIAARGVNCYTIKASDSGFVASSSGSGTSFSTPLIAGLCASLWSAVPELTPDELRQVVNESASDYLSPNILTGYGLPDFEIALKKAREMKGYSGIENITIEAANSMSAAPEESSCYYNLMGQPVASPLSKGLYIKEGKVIQIAE